MSQPVGIDGINCFTSRYYLEMDDLAEARGVSPAFYRKKLGQHQMSVPPPGEDIVTLGANAAAPLIEDINVDSIELLIFATESGVDQSKAAGIYVHSLLGLSKRCRVFEVKQACYGATAGLAMAQALLRQKPGARALVIAADVARYGLKSAGEPTQGAGAVAMLLSSSPRLVAFEQAAGFHVDDVMDFWRPNYRDEALVDGKSSMRIYLHTLSEAWEHYRDEGGADFGDFARFCYHMPFTRMGEMAHMNLAKAAGATLGRKALSSLLEPSLAYNRLIGNTYAGSLYVGLASMLDQADAELDGSRVGFFSYGSGCMGEFFSGIVQPGFTRHTRGEQHKQMLDSRERIDIPTYESFYSHAYPTDGSSLDSPDTKTGSFRLAAVREHKRHYERIRQPATVAT